MLTPSSLFNLKPPAKYAILLLTAFCFYANTFPNLYALDDEAVIQKNDYVQSGFKGIGKILTSDAYLNYYRHNNSNQTLSGGRYRPLSIVLFAIEHQLWGESPYLRHLINIILYALCTLCIYYFLSIILSHRLPLGNDIAFISALLFTIHPIHTEVVANIKSSDEILSLLFIMLTFIFSIRYRETKKTGNLVAGMFVLFLALLSKEYALMLIFLMPILFSLRYKERLWKSVRFSLPWFGVIAFYLILRFISIGIPHGHSIPDVLNAPYLYASPMQQFASEICVLGKYLAMLFFPYPLAYDYGYAQLPYQNLSSPVVWVDAAAYLVIIYAAIKLWHKKNILAFFVLFFLFNLLPVSNFFMNIGTTMGERLIFHSSLGFTTIIAACMAAGGLRIPQRQASAFIKGVLFLILLLSFIEVYARNRDWKNNFTLFTTDVKTVPNSVKANDNAGAQWLNYSETINDTDLSDSIARKALDYIFRAVSIDSIDVTGYMNLGVAYCKLIQPDSAKFYWDKAVRLFPGWAEKQSNYSTLGKIFLYTGNRYGVKGDYGKSLNEIEQGIRCDPSNAGLWFNLGGTFFNMGQPDSARNAWLRVQQFNPQYPGLGEWLEKVNGERDH